ncbi:SbcC/MukB-like Walker B domain-containing protein [Novosphingobium clariflavum]|uniref:SbcC/MukB-like Walker B domain-containing protein n=1 Tax=Novosphingobium clariflavum TaxID=2029884 RepID=A0ABV6S4L9_9SPHN|nr:SbcC/MukB-like Walker B domain-containing protein [Novosphingobium clariflavum]
MIKLSRINLINWYTFERLSIDLRGSTSLIGPNGAGKSSILDAIQVVLTGNNRNYFQLNASANVTAGQTRKVGENRSVFDYCLGRVAGETLRSNCISYVSLVFEREHDGKCWTVGIGMSAVDGEQNEEVLGAFIAPDQSLRDSDFLEDVDGAPYVLPWGELTARLRKVPGFENLGHRPTHFTRRVLTVLGGKGHHADPEKFLKTLKNGLRIREMKSATEFVREFLLDPAGLDVEALRKSVSTWRGLLKKIEDLEVQKQQVGEAIAAYRELTDKTSEETRLRWVAGKAERDRLEEHLRLVTIQHESKLEEQALADRRLTRTREAIARVTEEIREISRALENDTREQAIREFRDLNLPIAQRAHAEADKDYQAYFAAIGGAAGLADRLLLTYGEGEYLRAKEALEALRSRVAGETGLAARDIDQIVTRLVDPLVRYVAAAQDAREGHLRTGATLRGQLRENREQLQTLARGGALVEGPTARLIDYLEAHGIAARPIAELVEVTDERWVDAAETLLGAARDALVVEPRQAQEAIALLRRQRRDYPGTQIVNTTKTGEGTQLAAAGSLADVIETDNPHARAFINRRMNGVRRVETEHDLLRHDRAVTPDCLFASGGSIENRRPAQVHRLGKEASRKNIPVLEELVAGQERSLASSEAQAGALKALVEDIQRFLDVAGSRSLDDLERARQSTAESVAQIRDNIRTLEGERPVEIRERLVGLKADLAEYEEELKNDEKAQRVSGHLVGSASEKLAVARDEFARAEAMFAERDVLAAAEREAALRDFDFLLAEHGKVLPALRNAAQDQAAKARTRVNQLLGQAPQKAYAYAHDAGIAGQFDREAGPEAQLAWLEGQQASIVNNTLSEYRDQAQEARSSIETSLKTDMLVKLHDRIEGAKRQIRTLNRSLQLRPFHGELYRIEVKPDRFYAEIVEIARRVQLNSIDVGALFEEGGAASGLEPSLMKGVERIKRMIDEGENVEQISDYRNYLQFELVTTTLDGERVTSDYAKRQGSGSGGEKQVPFYIAMACAMSSVCHSTEDNRDNLGLGIILFDEAFNALDGGNVNSCLALLREFNLQVFACAPIEKLGVFMEQMDTVLSVRRVGTTTMLYADYLKDEGRTKFREANPANEPFDLFKQRFEEDRTDAGNVEPQAVT